MSSPKKNKPIDSEIIAKYIGACLCDARRCADISQAEMDAVLDVNENTIRDWESGKSIIQRDILINILNAGMTKLAVCWAFAAEISDIKSAICFNADKNLQ